MPTQTTEIARVQTTEGEHIVNYILTLEYDPAETDPDDGYVTPAEWGLSLRRRHETDGDRFDDDHDTVGTFLCDAEDRPPTVHDVTDDVWSDLFDVARAEPRWTSWDDFVSSSRLIVRLTQEAGVP